MKKKIVSKKSTGNRYIFCVLIFFKIVSIKNVLIIIEPPVGRQMNKVRSIICLIVFKKMPSVTKLEQRCRDLDTDLDTQLAILTSFLHTDYLQRITKFITRRFGVKLINFAVILM